ncbi:hypothetical protein HDU67_007591 [Dinochytrium kinnereticum]|nr:hypothetical protein HDU67_007591 [Dinochytrium kinnereticum]
MRQLLIWCAKRAGPSVKVDGSPDLHSKFEELKERMVQGLMDKSINTSWYHRSDAMDTAGNENKKPNPRNVENAKKKAEQEAELTRLLEEERKLKEILQRRTAQNAGAYPTVIPSAEAERLLTPIQLSSLSDLCGPVFNEDRGQWVADKMELLRLEMDEAEFLAVSAKNEVALSQLKCERLFKSWVQGFEDERKARQRATEPMALLRLIAKQEA